MVNAKPLRGTYDSEATDEEEKQSGQADEQGTIEEQQPRLPKFYGRQKKAAPGKTPGRIPLRKFNPN